MQMIILLLHEVVFLGIIFAGNGTGHIEAGVTNRLQLRDLTQHGTNLSFGIVGKVSITDGVEVVSNFQLHIV